VVSSISLVGIVTFLLRGDQLKKTTFLLISLAVGALFGDAVIHLLPEIFRDQTHRISGALWILGGIFFSFLFEKFLRWKQEHGVHADNPIEPVGRIILMSDGLHNFVDGLLIGASYLINRKVGLATTFAVIFHEFPHEIGDFGVLIHAGYRWGRALLFNFLTGCLAILGVLAAFAFQSAVHNFASAALAATAGSFLYIAGSNLTPELHKENAPFRSLLQFSAMLVGAGFMLLLLACPGEK